MKSTEIAAWVCVALLLANLLRVGAVAAAVVIGLSVLLAIAVGLMVEFRRDVVDGWMSKLPFGQGQAESGRASGPGSDEA